MISNLLILLTHNVLFLIPGVLCALAIFPKSRSLVKTIIASLISSASIYAIVSFLNNAFGMESATLGIIQYTCIIAVLAIWAKASNPQFADRTLSDAWPIALISTATFISYLWKSSFLAPMQHASSAYDYASMFAKGTVPNLGFYTGMAADHSNYAIHISSPFWKSIGDAVMSYDISLVMFTLLYLTMTYFIVKRYSGSFPQAGLATVIMAFAPFEIFYTSGSIFGHPLAYIACFSLFLLFASKQASSQSSNAKDRNEEKDNEDCIDFRSSAILAGMICISIACTYYTSTIANIILCTGFIVAVLVEHMLKKSSAAHAFKDRRIWAFVAIAATSAILFLAISNGLIRFTYDLVRDASVGQTIQNAVSASQSGVDLGSQSGTAGQFSIRPYRDPNILGISAIRFQGILFLILGASFFFHILYRKQLSSYDRLVLLALIPTGMLGIAFASAGYPARAFDYLAVVALFAMRWSWSPSEKWHAKSTHIPSNYLVAVIVLILVIVSGARIMDDKRIYFARSSEEVDGASWIASNLNATSTRVFSDQEFINLLVSRGFYGVTGMADDNPALGDIFYNNDADRFLKTASSTLQAGLGVSHLAITKRMRESHILMLDIPQEHILNAAMIDALLQKVYDNGDVRIYSLKSGR